MAQIRTVRDVSIVDLYEPDAYFVMATPRALKPAIEITIDNDSRSIATE